MFIAVARKNDRWDFRSPCFVVAFLVYTISPYTVDLQMLVTSLRWFLDKMAAYAQLTHLLFGTVEDTIFVTVPKIKSVGFADFSCTKSSQKRD